MNIIKTLLSKLSIVKYCKYCQGDVEGIFKWETGDDMEHICIVCGRKQ